VTVSPKTGSFALTGAPPGVTVERALEELASLPEETRRAVAATLVALAARIEGTSSSPFGLGVSDTATATDAVEVRIGRGEPISGEATLGMAHGFRSEALYVPPSTWVQWGKPALAWLGKNMAEGLVQAGTVYAVVQAAQLYLAPAPPPTPTGRVEPPGRVVAVLHDPAGRPPPPPTGDVCLPPDEPGPD